MPFVSSTFGADLHLNQSRNFTRVITWSPSFRVEGTPVCCAEIFGVTLRCFAFVSSYKGLAEFRMESQTQFAARVWRFCDKIRCLYLVGRAVSTFNGETIILFICFLA